MSSEDIDMIRGNIQRRRDFFRNNTMVLANAPPPRTRDIRCSICLEPYIVAQSQSQSQRRQSQGQQNRQNRVLRSHQSQGQRTPSQGQRTPSQGQQSPNQDEESRSMVRIFPCRHVYHLECIQEWLFDPQHNTCPLCRRVLYTIETDESIGEYELMALHLSILTEMPDVSQLELDIVTNAMEEALF